MRYLKPALAIGSAGAMVIGLAGPAAASTDTVIDVKNDAPAAYDITKATFHHTKKGVRAKISVRNLRNKGEFVLAVGNRSNSKRFGLAATGHKNGKPTKKFYKYKNKKISRKTCKQARVGWHAKRDTLTMAFPVRCYKSLGKRVVIGVGSVRKSFPKGPTVDEGPYTILKR